MKPIRVNAVFFAKDKVLFPIGRDFMHYQIQYTPKQADTSVEEDIKTQSKSSKKGTSKDK